MLSNVEESAELQAIVQNGCDFFSFEFGIISHIKNDKYLVLAAIANIPFFKIGDIFELNDTFCLEVIKSGSTVSYNQVSEIGHLNYHPAFRTMQLESYIGTPIIIDGKKAGTLNFASLVAREIQFEKHEIDYIESVAKSISRDHAQTFQI